MASTSSGMVDPTKQGRFPVILGDSILNRSNPKELLTGIRYNHKPSLSTPTAPTSARLKPTASASSSSSAAANSSNNGAQSFDMNFTDDGGKFLYQGQRTTDPSQVVLIFDPVKQVFVMERVDSVFHMNLAATPTTSDADALGREFPHLEISKGATPVRADGASGTTTTTTTTTTTATKATGSAAVSKRGAAAGGAGGPKKTKEKTGTGAPTGKGAKAKEKPAKEKKAPGGKKGKDDKKALAASASGAGAGKETSRSTDFALPSRPTAAESAAPEAPQLPAKKKPDLANEQDEDSDDDPGLLMVEYPGGKPPEARFGAVGAAAADGAGVVGRTWDELLQGHDDEEEGEIDFNFDDGDDEEDGEEEGADGRSVVSDAPRLGSPVGQGQGGYQQQHQQHQPYGAQALGQGYYGGQQTSEEDGDGDDDDDALEAELMNALDEVEEDSDVSEEE